MANKKPWPTLSNLPWSTPLLESSLTDLCRQSGLSVGYGPSGHDIDNQQDLLRRLPDLSKDSRPARQELARYIQSTFRTGKTTYA